MRICELAFSALASAGDFPTGDMRMRAPFQLWFAPEAFFQLWLAPDAFQLACGEISRPPGGVRLAPALFQPSKVGLDSYFLSSLGAKLSTDIEVALPV